MKPKQKPYFYRVCPDGYTIIGVMAIATLITGVMWPTVGWITFMLTVFCVSFFRDPDRIVPIDSSFILSPADGVVQRIEQVSMPSELGSTKKEMRTRISIFLSVFDVHVNRVPVNGTVEKIKYVPGKFLCASLDKASKLNERNLVMVKMKNGRNVIFTQIAGLIARRIICRIREGQNVLAGQRYGMIKFGSRVDVYLPKGEVPRVLEGQRVIGGETILSTLGDTSVVNGIIR